MKTIKKKNYNFDIERFEDYGDGTNYILTLRNHRDKTPDEIEKEIRENE